MQVKHTNCTEQIQNAVTVKLRMAFSAVQICKIACFIKKSFFFWKW